MSSYDSCPYCDREAEDAISSNWFPIYACSECGTKFCSHDGPPCPECGSSDYAEYDRVYA
jgi:anaerobic ribonucleoside-triphosphate reductase